MIFSEDAPNWENEGTEPSTDLQTQGFQAGYKPPAGVFNWFWSKVSTLLSEIMTGLANILVDDNGVSIGDSASATASGDYNGGAAVGDNATVVGSGGAMGNGAESTNGGGAMGRLAKTTAGGAVGSEAESGDGFCGGYCAKSGDNGSGGRLNNIQLGAGTNNNTHTLQVYDKQITDLNGNLVDVGDINELSTTDYSSVVNAINEVYDRGIKVYKYNSVTTQVGEWIDGSAVYRTVSVNEYDEDYGYNKAATDIWRLTVGQGYQMVVREQIYIADTNGVAESFSSVREAGVYLMAVYGTTEPYIDYYDSVSGVITVTAIIEYVK